MRLIQRYGLLLLLAGFLLFAGQAALLGQDTLKGASATPAAGAEPVTARRSAPETVLEIVFGGGWLNQGFMSVLGLFSLVAVAVIIERLVNLKARKLIPAAFTTELGELIKQHQDNAERLGELCQRYPSPIAGVLRAGVVRAGRPLPEVEKAMEDAAARESAALRSKVRPLSVLSSVAPMVGLLGTVVGMILAFRTVSQLELGKTEALAEGIYLALVTTVAGLVIAIPAQMCAAWFHSRTDAIMRQIDEQLMETLPSFGRMAGNGAERQLENERGNGAERPQESEQLVGTTN